MVSDKKIFVSCFSIQAYVKHVTQGAGSFFVTRTTEPNKEYLLREISREFPKYLPFILVKFQVYTLPFSLFFVPGPQIGFSVLQSLGTPDGRKKIN